MTKKLVISVKYGEAKPVVVGCRLDLADEWEHLHIKIGDLKVFNDSACLVAHFEEIEDEE